jgi:hypothetical protein
MYDLATAMLVTDSEKYSLPDKSSTVWSPDQREVHRRRQTPRTMPCLAAKPETLLRLELLLQEPVVDLAAVSAVVKSDKCLRSHVVRLARAETGDPSGDMIPTLHECIVHIGISALRRSLLELPLAKGPLDK